MHGKDSFSPRRRTFSASSFPRRRETALGQPSISGYGEPAGKAGLARFTADEIEAAALRVA
jgi:hypothetical protein